MLVTVLITLLFDAENVFQFLPFINPFVLIVPFSLYLAVNVIDTLRLRMVIRQFDMKIGFRAGFSNSVIGILFNNVTPMAAGGHPFQIYHLTRHDIPVKTATNVILSRHVEKLTAQAIITLGAVPIVLQVARSLEFGRGIIYAGVGLVTALAVLLLLVLARPDFIAGMVVSISSRRINRLIVRLSGRQDWAEFVIRWTREMREQVAYLWNERTLIMLIDTLAGVLNQTLQGLSMWYMVTALTGVEIPVVNAVLTWIVVNQLVYYVPTPGASGSVEGMYTLVFASLTRQAELTFIAVFLWRVATYYLHIVFGSLIFTGFLRADRKRRMSEESVQNERSDSDD